MKTLIDELLPVYDVRSAHSRVVRASPAAVADAMERARIAGPLTRILLLARGLGSSGGRTLRESLGSGSFSVIGERPGEEIVAGITGRFWALRERKAVAAPADAKAFARYKEPGSAKGAMSVRIEAAPGGRTRLSTETRVACTDDAARRSFRRYWMLIRPFSGLIRWELLGGIARAAEQSKRR